MTAAYTDPFLEGIYTALHYDFSNAILIYLKYTEYSTEIVFIYSKEEIETTY